MNLIEIQKRCQELASKVGPAAYVDITISHRGISACVYTKGVAADRDVTAFAVRVTGDDSETLLTQLEAGWRAEDERRGGRIIEKMALEIIRLTAELGECTDAALRAEFGEHVAKHSEAALSRANDMAANGPFSITRLVSANAA